MKLEVYMQQTRHIVVPLDLGTHTDALIEYASYMAGRLSARISFVHVIESHPGDYLLFGNPAFEEIKMQREDEIKQMVADLVRGNALKHPGCSGEVVYGEAVEEIVKFSQRKNADLIIISTHGHKGLDKILLGSVAQQVVKRAHCPVLVMNPYR
jgi:nucleotide-binding universal stress UspA family protein